MPLHLPYMNSQAEFEYVDGEIEWNGMYYNYVKRKVSNDTLYLMCLPNRNKTKLYEARNDYAKQANDIPSEKNAKSGVKKMGLSNEYYQPVTFYGFLYPHVSLYQRADHFASRLINSFTDDNYKPPRM